MNVIITVEHCVEVVTQVILDESGVLTAKALFHDRLITPLLPEATSCRAVSAVA